MADKKQVERIDIFGLIGCSIFTGVFTGFDLMTFSILMATGWSKFGTGLFITFMLVTLLFAKLAYIQLNEFFPKKKEQ